MQHYVSMLYLRKCFAKNRHPGIKPTWAQEVEKTRVSSNYQEGNVHQMACTADYHCAVVSAHCC